MKPTPTTSVVIGILVMAFSVYWLLNVLVIDPITPLTKSDIKTVSGKLISIQEVRGSPKDISLDVVIDGQPYPFRFFGGLYPKFIDQSALKQISNGQIADVGVQISEVSPRLNRLTGKNFMSAISLNVGGQSILTVENYNKWRLENLNVAKWFIPTMFLLGCYVAFQGFRGRRMGLNHTPGMF